MCSASRCGADLVSVGPCAKIACRCYITFHNVVCVCVCVCVYVCVCVCVSRKGGHGFLPSGGSSNQQKGAPPPQKKKHCTALHPTSLSRPYTSPHTLHSPSLIITPLPFQTQNAHLCIAQTRAEGEELERGPALLLRRCHGNFHRLCGVVNLCACVMKRQSSE